MFTSPEENDYKKKKGTRLEVYHGVAYCCGRGKKIYTQGDLELNDLGKIMVVSKEEPKIGIYASSDSAIESFKKKYGSREQVFNGLCYCTKSGLTKDNLMLNAKGKIVSRRKSELARERFNKKKQEKEEKIITKEANKIVK